MAVALVNAATARASLSDHGVYSGKHKMCLMLLCAGTDAGIMFLTYDLLISSARQTKQEAAAAKAAREQQARNERAGDEINENASDQTCAGMLEFGEVTQIPQHACMLQR